ncbi:MAG: hypothetical protein WD757_04890 [Actinomycetota bacterium]
MAGGDFRDLQIEYVILADGAQVQGGKLYVLGGGWDRIQFPDYPKSLPLGLAFGIRVPWTETNRKHTFRLRGVSADGNTNLFEGSGEFEMGRPAGFPEGMSQVFQVAMQIVLSVPSAGEYSIEATLDGDKASHAIPFYAVKTPGG